MAERMVSPGIFTKENDLSFLPQGIAEIGAAFIGPTVKGPAFRPVIVESQADYTNIFGDSSPDFYTPYAVRSYLNEASRATIVRVLGKTGYDSANAKSWELYLTSSAGVTSSTTGEYVIGYLHPSKLGVTLATGTALGATKTTEFTLTISGASGPANTYYSMSIDPASNNYFAKVLGTSANTGKDAYAYATFPSASAFIAGASIGSASVAMRLRESSTIYLNFKGAVAGMYSNAHTPMIRSQVNSGLRHNLFQFYTLGDGGASNTDVKISIVAVRPSTNTLYPYGTFGVQVRAFDDTDARPSILEEFSNLNLDPSSANYIARKIGTARTATDDNGETYLDGEYPNRSKYIYVDMDAGIEDIPTNSLPYSFAPLNPPICSTIVPAPNYILTRYANGIANNKIYYGFDFTDETGLSYLQAVPLASSVSGTVGYFPTGSSEVAAGGVDPGFYMDSSSTNMMAATDLTDIAVANTGFKYANFTVPFQGGFDGQNPALIRKTGADILANNTMGYDLTNSTSDGSVVYKDAITTISNPDAWDINMLMLPGVVYSLHPYVATLAIDLCESRGDAFYIMDPEVCGASVSSVVGAVEGLDTSYAGVYHPWVKVLDTDSNKNIWVPPSVVMGGVYAFNDKVSAEWFAPAGLNRGGVSVALQVRSRLAQPDRDDLYEGRVNPIAQFPGQGIVTWGQKTLQQQASALDRINVRRLLIAVKKFIASSSRYLVFEQNVEATRARFLSIVNPYLSSVQERNGLYAFKVVMDDTNNTPDLIDRNILVGDLYLKPTKTAEFIVLNFNVTNSGATFPV